MESQSSFVLYACLPFVELEHETSIEMGPVTFWPSSKYQDFLDLKDHSLFNHYVHSIGQIKSVNPENHSLIQMATLPPQTITCVSFHPSVKEDQREFVLIDALYLLYFACTFRNLYYTAEVPPFAPFRKMVPASLEFIKDRSNWENQHIQEIQREETICLHLFDPEICAGLGKALDAIYASSETNGVNLRFYKRLIRSIRYMIDQFFQRFVNLFDKGLHLTEQLFNPEDVVFLASSFEALFDINDHQPAADFKHKVRPLLHLKYSRPVELFWKWVDEFYETKRNILNGKNATDPLFQANPNFKVSHLVVGAKLFIYSIYYKLFKYQLISSKSSDLYTPPDFKWIHPEEVLLFFWTEENLLRKLALFLQQLNQKTSDQELRAEITLIANLFVSMYERYYRKKSGSNNNLIFIPTPLYQLKPYQEVIEKGLSEWTKKGAKESSLLPEKFGMYLQERLNAKS